MSARPVARFTIRPLVWALMVGVAVAGYGLAVLIAYDLMR